MILSLGFDDENKTLNAKCKQGLQKPKVIEIFFTYFSLYVCLTRLTRWFTALTKFQVSTLTGRIQDFEENTGDTLAGFALAAKSKAVQSNLKKSLMDSFKLFL